MKKYNHNYLLMAMLLLILGCNKWDIDKRSDHDFVTFNNSVAQTQNSFPTGIVKTSDNNYLVYGTIIKNSNSNIFLLKTNASGKIIWPQKVYNTGKNEDLATILMPDTESIYIFGNRKSSKGNNRIIIFKTDNNGNLIQGPDTFFSSNSITKCYGAVYNSNGNFYIAGSTNIIDTNKVKPCILEVSKTGMLIGGKPHYQFSDNSYDYCSGIINFNNGYLLSLSGFNPITKMNKIAFISVGNTLSASSMNIIRKEEALQDSIILLTNFTNSEATVLISKKNNLSISMNVLKFTNSKIDSIQLNGKSVITGLNKLENGGWVTNSAKMELNYYDSSFNLVWEKTTLGKCTGNSTVIETPDKGLLTTGYDETSKLLLIIKTDFNGDVR
jgi:hypothetical protein